MSNEQDKERAAFEAWARRQGLNVGRTSQRPTAMYDEHETFAAWESWQACAAIKDAEMQELREALAGFVRWAGAKCPCENERPNPCTLCGVSVESGEGCKAADATLPRNLLESARAALQKAST